MIIEIECILKVPLRQRMNDKHAFQFKLEGTIHIFLSPFLLNIPLWDTWCEIQQIWYAVLDFHFLASIWEEGMKPGNCIHWEAIQLISDKSEYTQLYKNGIKETKKKSIATTITVIFGCPEKSFFGQVDSVYGTSSFQFPQVRALKKT